MTESSSVRRHLSDHHRNLQIMGRVLLIMCVLCSQVVQAQKSKKPECVLEMDIPARLLVISNSDKEIIYRDRKTDAIVRFTKVGVTDFEFNLEFTADQVFEEISQDPTYSGANLNKREGRSLDYYIMEWQLSAASPNRKNDYNSMVMIDVCGQYYNISISMSEKKKEAMMPIFEDIVASLDTTKP